MGIAQPPEWNRRLGLTVLTLLLVNLTVAALLPTTPWTVGADGTPVIGSPWHHLPSVAISFLLALPLMATLPGILLAFFLDKNRPFGECVVRGWLICMGVIQGLVIVIRLYRLL